MVTMGIDLGYDGLKGLCDGKRAHFPSVVGTPDRASFSLNADQSIIMRQPGPAMVGQEVINQSTFHQRREDRDWITSDAWYILFCAGIAKLTDLQSAEVTLVTGLPCLFWERDKSVVQQRLMGDHHIELEGRKPQAIRVREVRVIKQPVGTVLSEALDNDGNIIDNDLQYGDAGVIDIGGGTTNFAAMHALGEIKPLTGGANTGMWHVVRRVREYLSNLCPELDLRDHAIAQAIIKRQVHYFNEVVPLGDLIDEVAGEMAEQVIGAALSRWKDGGASLQQILVTGGGAHILGPYICRHFRHARVVSDPVFANALGYWRFARRIAQR